jgi:hypothetical protein
VGRRAAPARGAGSGAPGRPDDYQGSRRGSEDWQDQQAGFGGGAPDSPDDFSLPGRPQEGPPQGGRPQGGGHRGRGRFLGRGSGSAAETAGRSLPPTRPPDDDAALSPLPPLPPRAPRRSRWEGGDPYSDGTPPGGYPGDGWDQASGDEPGQATDDEWDRARRDERHEQDW